MSGVILMLIMCINVFHVHAIGVCVSLSLCACMHASVNMAHIDPEGTLIWHNGGINLVTELWDILIGARC